MARVKIIVLLIGVLLLFLTLVYFYLGGFKPITTSITSCSPINLLGVEYLGIPQDERIGDYFRMVERARKEAPLQTIYYIEPDGKRDTLHVFIGFESNTQEKKTTSPWTYESVNCAKAIVAKLEMNRLVMPGPEKTKKAIQAFAKEKGVELEGIYIDKIISSDIVEVWAPIRE